MVVKRRVIALVIVRALISDRTKGRLTVGGASFACALGRSGLTTAKREGDRATPRAELAIRRLWRRPDKGPRPATALACRAMRRDDGWCDAPAHPRYNRPVRLPFPASHERMWRDDALYDLVGELSWNDRPAKPGRGSAIFLHAARPGFSPTEGCVALEPAVLRRLAARLGPATRIRIGLPPRKRR